MKNKIIYIVRHGETEYNRLGRVQGRSVDAPINAKGVNQAKFLCNYLKTLEINKIYTSSLKRTQQTIASLQRESTENSGFDEMDWGCIEGVEITGEIKQEFERITAEWEKGNMYVGIAGGENPIQVMERQKDAISDILKTDDENILISTHGRALRIMVCWLLNYPLSYMDNFPHQNCCLYSLVYNGSFFRIKDFFKTDHLL